MNKSYKNIDLFIVLSLFIFMLSGCISSEIKNTELSSNTITNTPTASSVAAKTIRRTPAPTRAPNNQIPQLIDTTYDVGYSIVADIDVTKEPYNADPTGVEDCSAIIQDAVFECFKKGGGTVYLPEGKYRITEPIILRPYVTICGDWQDPDIGNDYGTIILADVQSTNDDLQALFTIAGSSGVVGLTIYYPDQSIDNVKPYPYTFYIDGDEYGINNYMLQTIQNCTVINGYKGIGANVAQGNHEMMTVRNVKGTFLYRGASLFNSADVDTWKSSVFSNKYWAEAGAGLKKADRKKLDDYTRKNGIGMTIGSLEWAQFADVKISDYSVGINVVKGQRIDFTGAFYDLYIERCNIGLKIDFIDIRWGMVIARSKIEGSEKSIINDTDGIVKMTGVTLAGSTNNRNIVSDHTSLSSYRVDYNYFENKKKSKLFIVDADKTGKTDCTDNIQKALDDAGKAGGGVVYIPAGYYRIEKPIQVPANTELRGSSLVATRNQAGLSRGTVLMAYYGKNSTDPDNSQAQITLGENAGVWGLTIIYPQNNPSTPGQEGKIKPYPYAIRGKGDNVYAVNISISGGYNGVDFRNCDNTFIQRLVTASYNNEMFIGNSTGGMIEDCLQNCNVITRTSLRNTFSEMKDWIKEENMNKDVLEPVTRPNFIQLKIDKAQGLHVLNIFSYGARTIIENNGGTNILIVNSGSDGMGESTPMLDTKNGNLVSINVQRWRGHTYDQDGTSLKIHNIIAIENTTEPNVK